ncbi:MAG: hypothetical protein R3A13_07645 [Bdellovibrionota bacterium]
MTPNQDPKPKDPEQDPSSEDLLSDQDFEEVNAEVDRIINFEAKLKQTIRNLASGNKLYLGNLCISQVASAETPIEISREGNHFYIRKADEFADGTDLELYNANTGESIPEGTVVLGNTIVEIPPFDFVIELPALVEVDHREKNSVTLAGGAEGSLVVSNSEKSLAIACLTGIHTEARRHNNEDGVIAEISEAGSVLCCVADGMGGHADGELASRSLLLQFKNLSEKGKLFFEIARVLNQVVIDDLRDGEFKASSVAVGSTFAAFRIYGNELETLHTGDSKVLVFREGQQIPCFETVDHNRKMQVKMASDYLQALSQALTTYLIKQIGEDFDSAKISGEVLKRTTEIKRKFPILTNFDGLRKGGFQNLDPEIASISRQALRLVEKKLPDYRKSKLDGGFGSSPGGAIGIDYSMLPEMLRPEPPRVEVNRVKLKVGDIVIAASDGLTDLIPPILLNRLVLKAFARAKKDGLDHQETAQSVKEYILTAARKRLENILEGRTKWMMVVDNLTFAVHVHHKQIPEWQKNTPLSARLGIDFGFEIL